MNPMIPTPHALELRWHICETQLLRLIHRDAPVQVEAEKLLLAQALSDPLNSRFMLLSETCVPLYPAPLVWAQLQGETRSRLNACANASDPDNETWRMTYRSAADPPCCVAGMLECGVPAAPLHPCCHWFGLPHAMKLLS